MPLLTLDVGACNVTGCNAHMLLPRALHFAHILCSMLPLFPRLLTPLTLGAKGPCTHSPACPSKCRHICPVPVLCVACLHASSSHNYICHLAWHMRYSADVCIELPSFPLPRYHSISLDSKAQAAPPNNSGCMASPLQGPKSAPAAHRQRPLPQWTSFWVNIQISRGAGVQGCSVRLQG